MLPFLLTPLILILLFVFLLILIFLEIKQHHSLTTGQNTCYTSWPTDRQRSVDFLVPNRQAPRLNLVGRELTNRTCNVNVPSEPACPDNTYTMASSHVARAVGAMEAVTNLAACF